MIFFRKRRSTPRLAVATPLNPDFNFWENRSAHAQEAGVTSMKQVKAPAPAQAAAASTDVSAPMPPDRAHTLLVNGKWVRPWGLRNFAYSFVAFIGVQLLAGIALILVAASQLPQSAFLGDPTALSDQLLEQTMKVAQGPGGLLGAGLAMYAVWLGCMAWATRYRGERSWRKDFKLSFKWWDILVGLGSAGALLGIEAAVTSLIQKLAPTQDYSGIDNGAIFSNQSGIWFFVVGIGIAGIVGPLCEELYFRGFLLTGIQRWLGHYAPRLNRGWVSAIAIIASSILFGSLHFQGLDTFGQILVPFLTGSIGVVLALYRVFFKRLGPGIFTHMSYNTTSLLLAYFAVSGH